MALPSHSSVLPYQSKDRLFLPCWGWISYTLVTRWACIIGGGQGDMVHGGWFSLKAGRCPTGAQPSCRDRSDAPDAGEKQGILFH